MGVDTGGTATDVVAIDGRLTKVRERSSGPLGSGSVVTPPRSPEAVVVRSPRQLPPSDTASMTSPAYHYARSRERLSGLFAELDAADWDRPVPACPEWRVRDVLAHLYGNTEDALAGRLTVPPPPELTAAQVARHGDDDPAEMVRSWTEVSPRFEEAIDQLGVWPAAIDAVTHEHDIRNALDRPGARDDESVRFLAGLICAGLPVTIVADGDVLVSAPEGSAPVRLDTTAFEVLRLRLGRRTRAQVEALAWTGDPAPILDALFVFGPAAEPIGE